MEKEQTIEILNEWNYWNREFAIAVVVLVV